MNKNELKKSVLDKTKGRCAYCGKPLTIDNMQIDHIVPLYRGWSDEYLADNGLIRGKEDISNYFASCASCNRKKGTDTIEQFRKNLADQTSRLILRSAPVRQALDFGMLVKPAIAPIIFEFEKQRMMELRNMKIVIMSDLMPSDVVYVYFEGETEIKRFFMSHRHRSAKCVYRTLFIDCDDDDNRLSIPIPFQYTSQSFYHSDGHRAWICTDKYVAMEKMVEFWNKTDVHYKQIW